jgi:hypothetical protein
MAKIQGGLMKKRKIAILNIDSITNIIFLGQVRSDAKVLVTSSSK